MCCFLIIQLDRHECASVSSLVTLCLHQYQFYISIRWPDLNPLTSTDVSLLVKTSFMHLWHLPQSKQLFSTATLLPRREQPQMCGKAYILHYNAKFEKKQSERGSVCISQVVLCKSSLIQLLHTEAQQAFLKCGRCGYQLHTDTFNVCFCSEVLYIHKKTHWQLMIVE